MPSTSRHAPNTSTDGATKQPNMAAVATAAATTIACRSPSRAARLAEGTSPSSWPMPSSATRNPAVAAEAPSSSALIAMTGATAPLPIS
jgi:hypothetical protein